MKGCLRRLRNERGVAMITVLFVGAGLTAVTSIAAFATVQEFRAGKDDRKASEALSYAEAGVDRFIDHLRSGAGPTFSQLNQAGCSGNPEIALPPGRVGNGTFTATVSVYDPTAEGADRFAPAACLNRPLSPHPGQDGNDNTFFVITSKGQFPKATRVVRQVVSIRPGRLPIGIYANSITKQSAKHEFVKVSMVSETTIQNRSSLDFEGIDPYYKYKDFFPQGVVGVDPNAAIPAAAHAAGGIYLGGSNSPEFTGPGAGTKNCTANGTSGSGAYQSIWDSDGSTRSGTITSGCGSTPGVYPVSSKFTADQLSKFIEPELTPEDHQALKSAAKSSGIYCSFKGQGGTGTDNCWRAGVAIGTDYEGGIQTLLSSGTDRITAYFEFRSGTPSQNNIGRLGNIWSCETGRSIVAVVKNGGVDYGGGSTDYINGAIIMDGGWSGQGKLVFNGSLITPTGNVHFHSSSQSFQMSDCWVQNMPFIFMKVVPGHWSEVDR
ncbi:hypothetical protein BH20ACT23_BH20ACT23_06640 [soil metagenome]